MNINDTMSPRHYVLELQKIIFDENRENKFVNGLLDTNQLDFVFHYFDTTPLIFKIVGIGFGFGKIGLAGYEAPTYPGLEPEPFVLIPQDCFPTEGYKGIDAHRPTYGSPHEDVWELFSKYTHSKENLERLKFVGWEAPRKLYDYAY